MADRFFRFDLYTAKPVPVDDPSTQRLLSFFEPYLPVRLVSRTPPDTYPCNLDLEVASVLGPEPATVQVWKEPDETRPAHGLLLRIPFELFFSSSIDGRAHKGKAPSGRPTEGIRLLGRVMDVVFEMIKQLEPVYACEILEPFERPPRREEVAGDVLPRLCRMQFWDAKLVARVGRQRIEALKEFHDRRADVCQRLWAVDFFPDGGVLFGEQSTPGLPHDKTPLDIAARELGYDEATIKGF